MSDLVDISALVTLSMFMLSTHDSTERQQRWEKRRILPYLHNLWLSRYRQRTREGFPACSCSRLWLCRASSQTTWWREWAVPVGRDKEALGDWEWKQAVSDNQLICHALFIHFWYLH